jgi:TolB-like protein/DNA-binding winged helix-turn-helix (wHTH) protein/cytochrome c-type biogenesis protein CcmH/NrfG
MTDPASNSTPPRTRLVYRLDDLTIDVGKAQVHRGDRLIALPKLSFDLLLALVKAAPDLVTVDQLMEQVWPGVVVNAETVSQRIKLLRAALEDDPKQPRYIAVSRGRGYRILAPVTEVAPFESPFEPAAHTERAEQPVPTQLPLRTWSAVALTALALIAILVLFLVLRRDRLQSVAAPEPAPASTTTALTLPDHSVAVLPFDNLGSSPEDAALAFGVAETLLHRLSASKEMTVIARQSSFSFAPRGADVREIGRKLNARYLVEGSLQSTADRLRITAQLIDATTGAHVWSLQFDRKPQDIFVVQDEIATKVAEALRISMTSGMPAQHSGTRDFDAYLAYTQGRAHLATSRFADAKLAVGDFERAMQIDPKFARAYAALAEARMFVADGEMSKDRLANMEQADIEAGKLLERALALDERDSETHLKLAILHWEGERAEQELARALELNPNSAAGYELLAEIRLWRDRLPDEAMVAIDKARTLSPLETRYDNEKARIALYAKSDVETAKQLSLSVLEREPSSTTALWRLGEIYWCCSAEYARGVKYLEQALQGDPDFEFGRRILMKAYLDLGDPDEAKAIAASAPHAVDIRQVMLLAYAHDWRAAAERTYAEAPLGTAQAIEADYRILAVRLQARATGKYQPAREYLEARSFVVWDASGNPSLHDTWYNDHILGFADLMLLDGERERARKLLDVYLKSVDDEAHTRGRGDRWYLASSAVAYALLERDDEALSMLEESLTQKQLPGLLFRLQNEPAFDHLRDGPRFKNVIAQLEGIQKTQRAELEKMRAAGLIVHRSRT